MSKNLKFFVKEAVEIIETHLEAIEESIERFRDETRWDDRDNSCDDEHLSPNRFLEWAKAELLDTVTCNSCGLTVQSPDGYRPSHWFMLHLREYYDAEKYQPNPVFCSVACLTAYAKKTEDFCKPRDEKAGV